ncbi:MAG TPA: WecB/TagA/CpsF family glycosyltransferase [Burkholderiales bacterium]|nr:WecB/TagA/CpsF family glycosyltransferase [Burkholderiales bacterium]
MRTETNATAHALPDFNREVHCLLGLPFDAVARAGAEARIRAAAGSGARCFLSTPNVNFVVHSRTDESFRRSVLNSDLSVVDGMPLVWLARLLGIPLRERVAGASLFESLRRPAGKPLSVYFFGGPDGAAEAAWRALGGARGGLVCVGYASPGFGSVEDMSGEELIAHINAAQPDLLVVSLGARKGQAWIERNRARLDVPVVSHLGAVLKHTGGLVRRAPAWMQRAGLEWLWRIKEEPALYRRYARDAFGLAVLLATRGLPYAWYLRRRSPSGVPRIEAREEPQSTVLRLRGAWTGSSLARLRRAFHHAVRAGKHVRLEMAEVTHIDSAFVGLTMLLEGHQKKLGRQFHIASLAGDARRVFDYCCAEYLYAGAAASVPADERAALLDDEATYRPS